MFCGFFCTICNEATPLLRRRINLSFAILTKFLSVPRTGLEPACLTALPPQGSASTNFATWARTFTL